MKKKSHTARNIVIALILIGLSLTGIAVASHLPGFLNSSHPTSFPVIIHAYDTALASGPDTVTETLSNVTFTVSGPLNITQFTPSGVLAGGPLATVPIGTYQVTGFRDGYNTSTLQYDIRGDAPNCDRQDSVGNCHIWIAMSRTA